MSKFSYIFLFFCGVNLYAQDFKKVDQQVLNYPNYNNLDKLTDRISKDFKTDLNKVRAVYTWITANIAYSYDALETYSYTYTTQEELLELKRLQRIKTAKSTFVKKYAVCHGYSTLFNEMTEKLNIKSRYVTGTAKRMISDIGEKQDSNHAWNVVEINNKEYLIDATWGAGTYGSNGFKKETTPFYFLTKPTLFFKNHYPDNFEDALLDTNISKFNFLFSPLVFSVNAENIEMITPKNGILKKERKQNFKFKVSTKIKSIFYALGNEVFMLNEFKVDAKNILSFSLNLSETNEKELLIFMNEKSICGFKLK